MFDEVIKKIIESIDEKSAFSEAYTQFSGEGYKAFRIDAKNFQPINKMDSGKKIAFVDGGNAEIIGAANFSLCLIRAGYVIYYNNVKIDFKKFEMFALVNSVSKNNEIYYEASFIKSKDSVELDEMTFNSFDHTLMAGINRAEIKSVANAIRRFAELKLAEFIANRKIAEVIVLDGNLQSTLTYENEYLDMLYKTCINNNIYLTAISKTSTLFTDNGNLLSVVLGNISHIPSWYYHPIVEIKNERHKAEMFLAKFHSKSKHVFRFEIFKEQKAYAEIIINGIAANCYDPIFIGYPYGLIEADKIARISNHEKASLKTIFLVKLGNKNIGKYLSSVNAHEILDRISF